jgi:CRP/FNR family transcriptional regulator
MKFPTNNFTQNAVSCNSCSLRHLCIPNGLNTAELEELENAIDKTVKVAKKHEVYKSNDEIHGIYAVKSGAIKTSIINSEGQEQILEFHLPGDLLGFDAFETNKHSCDAIALEDSLLCMLPMNIFENLCDKLPGLRRVMMQQIGKEISHSQNLLLSLGQLPTEERLASYLLQLAEHFHSRGFSKSEFILPMSRQDLSNYLGMAVETLSRIISRMSNEKLIKIEQRTVIISNLGKLEKLAHASCSGQSTR